jgi:hypothetical protein
MELYRQGLEYRRTTETQEARCAMYNRLRSERLKARVLNGWLIFKKKHLTAKDYWYRIFIRLDLSLKR